MTKSIKSVLFVICAVMFFTAQTNPPEEKKKQNVPASRPAASKPAASRPAPAARNNQSRPQVQTRQQPRPAVQRAPAAQTNMSRPSYQGRPAPQVYAVPQAAPVQNNRLLNRQSHNHWQPRYNFYDNQYHFYPYVNISALVELTGDCVSVGYNGQNYYYDAGTFYMQDASGRYVALEPPIGIIVPSLPGNAHQIIVDGQVYFRYYGVFYVQVPQGFQVIAPVAPDPNS